MITSIFHYLLSQCIFLEFSSEGMYTALYKQMQNYHRIISYNHRIFGVGRNLQDHIVPSPTTTGRDHLPLEKVAQNLVQPGLEHFQGGGINHFSGQPVPVPYNPHSKELLPYI